MASLQADTRHMKAREKVCCICFCSKGQKASRTMTEDLEQKLRRSFPRYNSNDERFATGLCSSCQRMLASQDTNKPRRFLLEGQASLQPVTVRTRTRSKTQIDCDCKICQIASLNGNEWKRYISKKDPKRHCPRCGAEIYRGSNHSQATCEEQVLKNLTHEQRKKIAKEYLITSNPVPPPPPPPPITLDEVSIIQSNNKLSNQQTIGVLRDMRLKLGRKAFEPNIKEKLPLRNNILEDLFICSTEEFEVSDSKTNIFPLVYCTDIPKLIDLICTKRDLHILQIKIKIGIDFGKEHLRVTMSIWDPEDILADKGGDSRRTRAEGIQSNNKSNLGGDRVLIIASAPEVKESYRNFEVIFRHLKLQDLFDNYSCTFTGDLKGI